jgi:preprotein translocase subunit YajC
MKRGRNKRGSHVEVILSFAIFITFMVFLYAIIEPKLKTMEEKNSMLDHLEKNVLSEISAQINSTAIKILKDTTGKPCVKLNNFQGVIQNIHLITEDSAGILISHSLQGDSNLYADLPADKFLKASGADLFDASPSETKSNCEPIDVSNSDQIRLILRLENVTFEKKINELFSSYTTNYEELKNRLRVPESADYGFAFIDNTGQMIETSVPDREMSIYAREIPIAYLNQSADTLAGTLIVKVW